MPLPYDITLEAQRYGSLLGPEMAARIQADFDYVAGSAPGQVVYVSTLENFQQVLNDNPQRTIMVAYGNYVKDSMNDPNEWDLNGGQQVIFARGSTVTINNPTRGCFVLTSNFASVSNVKVIGAYGVGITGQERPNFNWIAGDTPWVSWWSVWNATHPGFTLTSNPLTTDFRTAWNTSIPTSPIGLYYGVGAAQRNCAFYAVTGNYQTISNIAATNTNCSVVFRGDPLVATAGTTGNRCFFLDVDYVEFGLQYQQQRVFEWDEITGRNGSHCQVQPQHLIYAGGNFDDGRVSTALCGRAHADNWIVSQAFKFKEGHTFLSPPSLSADGGQALLSIGRYCTGSIGLLLLTNQKITDPAISSQTFAAVEILDNPTPLIFLFGIQVYADTTVTDTNLKCLYIENSPGVRVNSIIRWVGAKSVPVDGSVTVNLNSDGVVLGDIEYNDSGPGAASLRAVVISNSNAVRIGTVATPQVKLTVHIIGTSSNCIINVDSRLVPNWNESSSVQDDTSGGTGGNCLTRFDGIKTIAPTVASVTLTPRDSGKLFTNQGSAINLVFTLPILTSTPSNRGQTYSFSVHDAHNIQIKASGNDKLYVGGSASSAAGHADCATIGGTITFTAISNDIWAATAFTATWTLT